MNLKQKCGGGKSNKSESVEANRSKRELERDNQNNIRETEKMNFSEQTKKMNYKKLGDNL